MLNNANYYYLVPICTNTLLYAREYLTNSSPNSSTTLTFIPAWLSVYVHISYFLYILFVVVDVDAPQDLAASNILTESGHLTWRPPRAEITGYILSFHATDGAVRVGGA